MKRAVHATLIILLIALAGGFIAFCLRPKEPVYAGKPLRYWLDILEKNTPGFNPGAEWETLGTNEVPVLIQALEHCDDPVPVMYAKLYSRYWHWIPPGIRARFPYKNSEDMGINAVLFLGMKGNQARPAFPALIHILKADNRTLKTMPSLRHQAAHSLSYLGDDDPMVIAAFVPLLNDPDPSIRRVATTVLKHATVKSANHSSTSKSGQK